MRIAVIADVHGNCLALEAVLADASARGVDQIVNLGDVASGPLEAARTIDLLIDLNLPTVRGNHDRWLVDRPVDRMGSWDRDAHPELSERHLDWLRGLPATCTIAGNILICHGTPGSDTTYWLETVSPGGIVHMAATDHIEAHAKGREFPVLLCGHTHVARIVRLADGRLIVNPGSVGSPAFRDTTPVPHAVEAGSPDARYAIVEKAGRTWTASLLHVPYDHMAMSRLAVRRNREDWAHSLATGRAG